MSAKLTYSYVKKTFEERNYKLLSTEYEGILLHLTYICPNGHQGTIAFNNFQTGHGCKKCATKKSAEKQKHPYEYVKKTFEERDCKLLSTEYENCMSHLKYICPEGHKGSITFDHFNQGKGCKKCATKKSAEKQKHPYEYVKKTFEERNYKLLSTEYANSTTKLNYICPKGHKGTIAFRNFQKGHGCNECGTEKTAEKRKHPYEYVKKTFEERDCKLLSTEYENAHSHLKYICPEGHKGSITFDSFERAGGCKKCATKKSAEKRKHPYEYVKKTFEEQDCILLSTEYINSKKYLDFICKCGKEASTTFVCFKQGVRCKQCGQSGANYSKNSQKLFHEIYKHLPENLQDDTWFGEIKGEYPGGDSETNKVRWYDFTIPSIKKCIEFNGVCFHAKPDLLPEQTGWQPYEPEMTAQESWDFDKYKNGLMEAEGFEVFVIWEDEKNQLEKCLEFLDIVPVEKVA